MKKIWAWLGKIIYRVGGVVALPIFLNSSRRTRIALIDKKSNAVLLVRVWIGAQDWTLPGGGIHRSEDKYISALREIKEEVGYSLKKSDLNYVGEIMIEEYMATFTGHVFYAYVDRFKPLPRKFEIMDAKWFKLNRLPKNHRSETIEMIKSAIEEQGSD